MMHNIWFWETFYVSPLASACCWESALGVSCFESIVDVVDGFVGRDMLNMTDMDSK